MSERHLLSRLSLAKYARLAGDPRLKPRRLPGDPGVWVFVLVDLVLFGLLFLSYVLERSNKVELFAQSQRALDIELGLTNTLVLLTSSWLVVLALHATKENAQKWIPRFLTMAALCGAGFVAIKIFEYVIKFQAGISMLTNDFFMFYFFITFIHFIHVVVGTIVLSILAGRARRGVYHPDNVKGIETAGVYWHMVDLLWVMLFPLIYLVSGK